jgi:acyl-CoA synthetase (AMP-forming)/AMP-acid ligase II
MQSIHGVQVHDRCAILAHNSEMYLAVSFGVMRARAVSVNLNWRSPACNLSELAQKSECTVLFSSRAFQDVAQTIASNIVGLRVVFLDDLPQLQDSYSPDLIVGPDNLPCQVSDDAVVFFTSGSTSLPKAVPHTHATLMWLSHAYLSAFPEPYSTDNPHASTLCFFPYFHVMGYSVNMVFNLYCGIKTYIHADAEHAKLSPEMLMR